MLFNSLPFVARNFYCHRTSLLFIIVLCFSIGGNNLYAQSNASFELGFNPFTGFEASEIGPTIQGGRVTDIDVNPLDPTEFYIAYATGGLWHTVNNGQSFEPLFQHENVITIGDIAVDWEKNVIYIGSGEQNSSRSSYAGNGIYKSIDSGKTWKHLGLDETHHIGKVIIHPENPDIVWIASLGHLYTNNEERGIYMTKDGGNTWEKTLYVNDSTGVIDIVIHPKDPSILYAASWERSRKAWHFKGSGSSSNIYMSSDGGKHWQNISNGNGFPTGEGKGRIGLDVSTHEGMTYLYAIIDNNSKKEKEIKKRLKGIDDDLLKEMNEQSFLILPDSVIQTYLEENDFDTKKYNAKTVKKLIKNNKISLKDLNTYNKNANSDLFGSPIIGGEIYRTVDNGKTWNKTHDGAISDLYYTYGYYFGKIHVDPQDYKKLYIYGVPILTSDDGGATWKKLNLDNVHSDHHALWINPSRRGHLIDGNDGGINITYDDGANWFKVNQPSVGQFYAVNVDDNEPYNVYGGAQDNGVWMGPNNYKFSNRWEMTGDYPYKMLLGGDGMQIQIDKSANVVYTGFQFGNYFKIDRSKNIRSYITPKHDLGSSPYRWNWQTPILLSPHNPDIIYMGANILLRSLDGGGSFHEISEDLTGGLKYGNVPYGTITTLDESPLKFGLIYVGTDDGFVHISENGGNTWTTCSGLPQGLWVSRVQASKHDIGTAYVSLNGYRNDDFKPYLYVTHDFGKQWQPIVNGLPEAPINVVKEDPSHKEILYVGTDKGLFVSTNKGNNFHSFAIEAVPSVPVHDLVVQTKENHLILGTHGRSMWKVDLNSLYKFVDSETSNLMVLNMDKVYYDSDWGKIQNPFTSVDSGEMKITVFSDKHGKAYYSISTVDGKLLKSGWMELTQGISSHQLDTRIDPKEAHHFKQWVKGTAWYKNLTFEYAKPDDGYYYLIPGKYTVKIDVEGSHVEQDFEIVIPK